VEYAIYGGKMEKNTGIKGGFYMSKHKPNNKFKWDFKDLMSV
jgi:hypothetical protein